MALEKTVTLTKGAETVTRPLADFIEVVGEKYGVVGRPNGDNDPAHVFRSERDALAAAVVYKNGGAVVVNPAANGFDCTILAPAA